LEAVDQNASKNVMHRLHYDVMVDEFYVADLRD